MTARAVAHAPSGWRPFWRHYGEMVLAMVLGMIVLGGALEGILALAGTSLDGVSTAAMALIMAFNMTAPMVAWMHRRGHAPARSAEMTASMVAPTLLAIALDAAGVIGPGAVLAVQHVVMFPAMLAVMLWRRDEYSHAHH